MLSASVELPAFRYNSVRAQLERWEHLSESRVVPTPALVDVIEGERERLGNHSEPPVGLSRAADASGILPMVGLGTVRIGSTAGSGTFRAGVVWVRL